MLTGVSPSKIMDFIFLSLFIYFEIEREREHAGGSEREGEKILSRLRTISPEPGAGLKLTA